MSHQLGSFLGAFGGGLLFDALGSYDLAWRLGVGMGLAAGIVQVMFALLRPLQPAKTATLRRYAMLSAEALGLISLFNVVGSLFFGWAGGRWSKLALLGMIYISRSIVLGWYFILPPTPATTLVFAALMGFLWLGVGPLVAGSVVEMFGLRWQAMIQGLAFRPSNSIYPPCHLPVS
jgi:hypothetical protein